MKTIGKHQWSPFINQNMCPSIDENKNYTLIEFLKTFGIDESGI